MANKTDKLSKKTAIICKDPLLILKDTGNCFNKTDNIKMEPEEHDGEYCYLVKDKYIPVKELVCASFYPHHTEGNKIIFVKKIDNFSVQNLISYNPKDPIQEEYAKILADILSRKRFDIPSYHNRNMDKLFDVARKLNRPDLIKLFYNDTKNRPVVGYKYKRKELYDVVEFPSIEKAFASLKWKHGTFTTLWGSIYRQTKYAGYLWKFKK